MILTTHIISGAALGAGVKNPYAVAGLAIVLHFLLDLLPHGDYLNKKSKLREFWKVAVDLTIGLLAVAAAIFFRGANFVNIQNVLIGIFFSLLPDGTTFLYIWMKMRFLKPIKDFHENLHCYANDAPKRQFGVKNNFWDIALSLLALLILIYLNSLS